MSVLIKGMDMPKSCGECDFENPFGEVPYCRRLMMRTPKENTRLGNCPLAEVPKHGRLIDADEMVKKYHTGSFDIAKVAKAMPTVIESEVTP